MESRATMKKAEARVWKFVSLLIPLQSPQASFAFPSSFLSNSEVMGYTLLQTILYVVLVYSMMDFTWTAPKFFWFTYFAFCAFLYFTYYGMMCVAVMPSHHVAAIVSSVFCALWNLFSGFIITYPKTRSSGYGTTRLLLLPGGHGGGSRSIKI